jgi:hypothetical protein
MPAYPHTPTVRAMRLGHELEQLRHERHMSPEDVAAAIGGSRFKVRNVETAKVQVKAPYLKALLSLYGVLGTAQGAALIELERNAWQRGWWTDFSDVFNGSFVGLENQAALIRSWQPQLVPGLLQIEGYARAVIRAGLGDVTTAEVDRRWQARRNRQDLLTREESAPRFEVVLDEAVLERPVGGVEVMRAQLRHLLEMAERPNVTIQVMAKAAGAHAGLEGPLVILSFPGKIHPDIAYGDLYLGDVYLESADDVARSNLTMGRIQKAALSPQESIELIDRLAQE